MVDLACRGFSPRHPRDRLARVHLSWLCDRCRNYGYLAGNSRLRPVAVDFAADLCGVVIGFLAEVFDTIRKRGVSVDLVATSETTTTIAINCDSNHLGNDELKDLAEDLSTLCKVTLFRDCVCINLVGRGARTALGRLQPVMDFFEDRPLLMVSQSANDLCLSLLVEEAEHEFLLRDAHRVLIPADPGDDDGIFGSAWEQLRPLADMETA